MQKGNKRKVQISLTYGGNDLCWYGFGKAQRSKGFQLDKWQQVALTCEYGKDARVYLDGELIGVGKADQEFAANNLPLLIGCDPFFNMEYFIGDMDDVRVYNRALSGQEIKELYEAESASSK